MSSKRQFIDLKNPGPGAYQISDKDAIGEHEYEQFKFPRGPRP